MIHQKYNDTLFNYIINYKYDNTYYCFEADDIFLIILFLFTSIMYLDFIKLLHNYNDTMIRYSLFLCSCVFIYELFRSYIYKN